MRIVWLDRERAIAELRERARELVRQDRRVLAVGLFGSLARGEAVPGSDADLLIVLESSPQERWIDRLPGYMAAFEGSALPVEPFPYTLDEVRSLSARPGFMRTALGEMILLAGEAGVWEDGR